MPSGCNVVSISTKYVGNNINKMKYKLDNECIGADIICPCKNIKNNIIYKNIIIVGATLAVAQGRIISVPVFVIH